MEPDWLAVVKVVGGLQQEEVVLQQEVMVLVSVEVVEWQCEFGSPPWIQSFVEVQL